MILESSFNIIKRIRPSSRDELATSSANSGSRKLNPLTYGIIEGEWKDVSAFESLRHANNPLFSIDNTIQPGECHADTL